MPPAPRSSAGWSHPTSCGDSRAAEGSRRPRQAGAEPRAQGGQPLARQGLERVPDPRPAPLAAHHACFAQHAQMVRDRWLGEAGGRGNVAGADGSVGGQLPHDRQPGRIGKRAKKPDIGIVGACHVDHVIDQLLY